MSGFKAQHSATRGDAGADGFARLGPSGEVVNHPFLWQQALEGNVYVWGHGVEETGQTSPTAALDNQIAQAVLSSPLSGTIVVPLAVTIRMTGDGATGLPDIWMNYIQTDVSMIGNGTAGVGVLNALGGPEPKKSNAVVLLATSGIDNYTDAQNVLLGRKANMLVDAIANEAGATDPSIEAPGIGILEFTYVPPVPFMLTGGASICFYSQTSSTGSIWQWAFQWAELDSDAYLAGHSV